MSNPLINNPFIDMLLIVFRDQGPETFFKRTCLAKEHGLLNEEEFEILMEKALLMEKVLAII
jgi:hypothetical protein